MKHDPTPTRRATRFMAGIRAFLSLGPRYVDCRAEDLSRTGVLLTGTMGPIEERDASVRLEATQGNLSVDLPGEIVHAHEVEDGTTRIGFQFTALDPPTLKKLDALVARVMEGTLPAPIAELAKDATPQQILQALERVTVAHRIQLAHRADGDQRKIMRHDPDADVVESLLRNPHLTPPELIALVRNSKLPIGALAVVAADPRWSGNEEIKLIIATHPRVTLQVAQQVVDKMSDAARKQVLRRSGLPDPIKRKILAKFSTRSLRGW